MLTNAPRGTKDILPSEINAWRYVEDVLRKVCAEFGFKEIRTPIFEHTELFQRGIGDTTDVVEKEMYTFLDRGERSITLRPENTASVVRAFVEHKLYADGQIAKLFYIGSMFRYDRPQAGRYREFHQFGIEALGSDSPSVDAESILLAITVLQRLGLKDLQLKINTVGCPNCRPQYRKLLQDFFGTKSQELCEDCQSRLTRNPMRILDCKNPHCHEIAMNAPFLTDCLCDDCRGHFEEVKKLLDAVGVHYEVDHSLVRGLDYYTKTAFEVQYPPLGAQSAVAGGGRYDGLVEEIGGPATSGIGFAMGLERVLLALEKQNLLPQNIEMTDVFVVCTNKEIFQSAFNIVMKLRDRGLKVEFDYTLGSMKSQMKKANKVQAKYVLIFGDDEFARGSVILKNMANSEQKEITFENIFSELQGVEK